MIQTIDINQDRCLANGHLATPATTTPENKLNMNDGCHKASQRLSLRRTIQTVSLIISLIVILSSCAEQTLANPLLVASNKQLRQASKSSDGVPVAPQNQKSNNNNNSYSNIENLISELLDDAGNRLKKSKLHSMRQIKQTLRFGRSDPSMAPTSSADDYYEQAGDSYERQRPGEPDEASLYRN